MRTNLVVSLIFVIAITGCIQRSGGKNMSGYDSITENESFSNVKESIEPDIVVNELKISTEEFVIADRDSLLPFFKDGVGYYIEKDTAITSRLLSSHNSPNIPFNTRVEVQEVLEHDVANKKSFFWVKLKGIDGKYPSFFFSNFKFPYTKNGYSLQHIRHDQIFGGRTGTKIDPPGTVDNIVIWQMDSLGWQESKEFISLSDIDEESGWIIKGIRINADSLSFNAAVQLFMHAAYLYDEGLNLKENIIYKDDVKIWYATFVLPTYKLTGSCRVIEKDGYIQILADSSPEDYPEGYFDELNGCIQEVLSKGQFDNRRWRFWISGDDFFEKSVFNQ